MNTIRRCRPLLGTFVEIAVTAGEGATLLRAIDSAYAAISRVHWLMSYHAGDSDLTRVNRARVNEAVIVDDWTWRVLAEAVRIHRFSGGLFDCTVAPVLERDGLLPRGSEPVDPSATQENLELPHPGIAVKRRALRLDLGGIAKGFAVDCAVEALKAGGVTAGSVNAGGDLRVFGLDAHRIHVRDPRNPRRLVPLIDLRDAAVATTANYFTESFVDGDVNPASSLIDPRTRRPIEAPSSVSVCARSCIAADALTKVVALSRDARHACLTAFDATAIVIDARCAEFGQEAAA